MNHSALLVQKNTDIREKTDCIYFHFPLWIEYQEKNGYSILSTHQWKQKLVEVLFSNRNLRDYDIDDLPRFSQFSSVAQSCLTVTSWTAAHKASLSITNSRSLLKLMSIESVMPSNHLILCRPLLLLPPIPPSIRVFSNESVLIRWPKHWSFSFSISPSSEYSGLIFFGMDWLDLLAVQRTLKSLHQHHSSKASILWCSAFFIAQIAMSHNYASSYPWPTRFSGLYHLSYMHVYNQDSIS